MFVRLGSDWKNLWVVVLCSLISYCVQAQPSITPSQQVGLARQYMEQKEFDKAIPIYKALYEKAPFDKSAYADYLQALLGAAQYQQAEDLVQYMAKIRREDPALFIDLGQVYEASGKKKKVVDEQYELAVAGLNGDMFRTKQVAETFERLNKVEYAIKAYERSRKILNNPYLHATEMALLFARTGDTERALGAMMDVLVSQPNTMDDVKSSMAQVINGEPKKLNIAQKLITKRISDQRDNPYWVELLTWLYLQNGDIDGAYNQITALDKNLGEQGDRVIRFSNALLLDGHVSQALKGFQYVMQKGEDKAMYEYALEGKLNTMLYQLERTRPIDTVLATDLSQQYSAFLKRYPQYISAPVLRNYAMVKALYQHQVDSAILLLETAINAPNVRKEFVGLCKLDLGDYYLLNDNVWEATLIYSQVDKAFKEDYLGEEARFRNAKLSYYRGDFKWAQNQLSVLKASTTELIANDALNLSVLITENIPADSNLTPLLRFAAADMLLFQHKTAASELLLDSIASAFPESELLDNIFMLKADIATEEGRFADAIIYLERIVKNYGDDVLGDDAVYKLATLYDERLLQKDKALQYYEKLITEYPGSSYIQMARARYNRLQKKDKPAS